MGSDAQKKQRRAAELLRWEKSLPVAPTPIRPRGAQARSANM